MLQVGEGERARRPARARGTGTNDGEIGIYRDLAHGLCEGCRAGPSLSVHPRSPTAERAGSRAGTSGAERRGCRASRGPVPPVVSVLAQSRSGSQRMAPDSLRPSRFTSVAAPVGSPASSDSRLRRSRTRYPRLHLVDIGGPLWSPPTACRSDRSRTARPTQRRWLAAHAAAAGMGTPAGDRRAPANPTQRRGVQERHVALGGRSPSALCQLPEPQTPLLEEGGSICAHRSSRA